MSTTKFEENLKRLLRELRDFASKADLSAEAGAHVMANKLASSVYLAHSTSPANFVRLCESDARLLSPRELDAKGIKPLKPNAVESALGTAGSVFFYASSFSFPSSGCGLLYARSLEEGHRDTGSATPFDSGGLVNHFRLPNATEPPHEFLQRHELPLPGHREYLSAWIPLLFADPFDYVCGRVPRCDGPLGLKGGDVCRSFTHEVRIPDEVAIRSHHLKAVFVPLRLSLEPQVQSLLKWCHSEDFDVVPFESDRGNDFERLKRAFIEYLRTKLL